MIETRPGFNRFESVGHIRLRSDSTTQPIAIAAAQTEIDFETSEGGEKPRRIRERPCLRAVPERDPTQHGSSYSK